MQPGDRPTNVQVAERRRLPSDQPRGWGQGRDGAGGVDGRGGTGWDVTSGALCIMGIPGPRRLVPVHSAAEPGGGGERGARGREARRRAGGRADQRGARREKARAARRAQAGHLAAAAAAEPPVSAARTPSPRAPSPPSGSGRRALPAAGAWERPGLALTSGRRA